MNQPSPSSRLTFAVSLLLSALSTYAFFNMQLEEITEALRAWASMAIDVALYGGVALVVIGFVLERVPEFRGVGVRLMRTGAYLAVGMGVILTILDALGISLSIYWAPAQTVALAVADKLQVGWYGYGLSGQIATYALIFMAGFLPCFAIGYAVTKWSGGPVFGKANLIALLLLLFGCMALLGVLLGFVVFLVIAPYYVLGASAARLGLEEYKPTAIAFS